MGHLAACEGPYFLRTARQPEPAADAVFRFHPEPSDQLFGPHRACLLIQTIAWQAPVSTVVEKLEEIDTAASPGLATVSRSPQRRQHLETKSPQSSRLDVTGTGLASLGRWRMPSAASRAMRPPIPRSLSSANTASSCSDASVASPSL
jgi:hypothetical protein